MMSICGPLAVNLSFSRRVCSLCPMFSIADSEPHRYPQLYTSDWRLHLRSKPRNSLRYWYIQGIWLPRAYICCIWKYSSCPELVRCCSPLQCNIKRTLNHIYQQVQRIQGIYTDIRTESNYSHLILASCFVLSGLFRGGHSTWIFGLRNTG